MKRKIFVPLTVTISLLASCGGTRPLRSDIKQFIASFSIKEARNTYLESSYLRTDLYHEPEQEIRTELSVSFNIKDKENATYEYYFKKYIDEELDEKNSHLTKIQKGESGYVVNKDGVESVIDYEQVEQNYVRHFFYRSNVADVHSIGMYMGDVLIEALPGIQDYVTTDFDNELLTYDIPFGVKKDVQGYDFSEVLVVNSIGMLVSFDNKIKSSTGAITVESHLEVTNII